MILAGFKPVFLKTMFNAAVKSFLPRPLLLQEGSPAAGVSFFAPDRFCGVIKCLGL